MQARGRWNLRQLSQAWHEAGFDTEWTENGDISSSASLSIVLLNILEWKDQGGHIPGCIPSSGSSVALSPTQIFNGEKYTWNNLFCN